MHIQYYNGEVYNAEDVIGILYHGWFLYSIFNNIFCKVTMLKNQVID